MASCGEMKMKVKMKTKGDSYVQLCGSTKRGGYVTFPDVNLCSKLNGDEGENEDGGVGRIIHQESGGEKFISFGGMSENETHTFSESDKYMDMEAMAKNCSRVLKNTSAFEPIIGGRACDVSVSTFPHCCV